MSYITAKRWAEKSVDHAVAARAANGEHKVSELAVAVECLAQAVVQIAGELHSST